MRQYTEEELRAEFEKRHSHLTLRRWTQSGVYIYSDTRIRWYGFKEFARFLGVLAEGKKVSNAPSELRPALLYPAQGFTAKQMADALESAMDAQQDYDYKNFDTSPSGQAKFEKAEAVLNEWRAKIKELRGDKE